jgi:hypothetical protein
MAKNTRHTSGYFFTMPKDIVRRATEETRRGVVIQLTPQELIKIMMEMDKLIDQDTGDTDHDAMALAREWMSDIFEDAGRRLRP